MKNTFSLVDVIIFFVMLSSVANKVKANSCQDPLGSCLQCDERCKAKHGPTGQASCDSRNQLCTCYYTCGPPSPTPPHHKQCYGGTGLCSSACNQNCAQKYLGGSGFCESIGNSRLCKCQYPC
ncbi:PREDICTED: defensin-like protein 183 [Brassica oleracea var. oleracea]|uniref:Defensin-like protein n=1 Tax=Brassica oleracea var. oleracea TaxID=109376 RepID=A0A0D3DH70_BRAOL|nr:PREDICTED: defensin-like protein 183 [Brassica oleracea var. oleracea]